MLKVEVANRWLLSKGGAIPHLHPYLRATNAPLPHAQRPPLGGYILTRDSKTWVLNPISWVAVLQFLLRNVR